MPQLRYVYQLPTHNNNKNDQMILKKTRYVFSLSFHLFSIFCSKGLNMSLQKERISGNSWPLTHQWTRYPHQEPIQDKQAHDGKKVKYSQLLNKELVESPSR
jgi:hypothetical protein